MATEAIASPHHAHAERHWLIEWLTTTDHKKIGMMYLMFTICFMVVGGILALIVRSQLAWSNNDLVSQEKYNQFFTMHALTMIFLAVMPLGASFSNFLIPLMLGCDDMVFPKVNRLSYQVFLLSALVLLSAAACGVKNIPLLLSRSP